MLAPGSPHAAYASSAMAEITVLCAALGGYDTPRVQATQDVPVDWVLVTDTPGVAPEPWRVIEHETTDDPRLAAKRPKMLPAEYADSRFVIWLDANMQVTSRSFARETVEVVHDGVGVWKHPRRDCIYAEVEASLGAESQDEKYAGMPLREQAEAYRAAGHPEHAGLYACGTIAWDTSDARAMQAGRLWLHECEHWTVQDQVSLPVVLRGLDITPGVFPVAQIERHGRGYLENRWMRLHPHLQ